MSVTTAIIAIGCLIGILFGSAAARSGDRDPATGEKSPFAHRLGWFCAGFFIWPFLACFLIFLLVFCWDLMFLDDRGTEEWEYLASR